MLGVDPGEPTRTWRGRVGLVLQECELDPLLTVREAVTLFATFYPAPRPVEETIELTGLTEKREARIGSLSGGQKRRVDVAIGIIGKQTVTLPTGLKPSAQAYFMAGITAYSISLSTFTTLAVSITTQRERGQLKRLRGTPMPAWTFILAQILRATAQALSMTVLLVAIGVLAYGVDFPGSSFIGFLVYVALGTATLCTLSPEANGLGIARKCQFTVSIE